MSFPLDLIWNRMMPKALTIAAMAIALILLVMFGLDLAIKVPFGRANPTMSIGFVLFAIALGYMGWSTIRELT